MASPASMFLRLALLSFSIIATLGDRMEGENWECACKRSNGSTVVFNSKQMCQTVADFEAVDEGSGKTCISYDQMLESCKNQMTNWWSDTIGSGKTPYPLAVHELSRMLRNKAIVPHLRAAFPAPQRIDPVAFGNWAAPKCVNVGFEKFQNKGVFTDEWGKGLLTDNFGTYPLKFEDIERYTDWTETLVVGGIGVVKEHPVFQKIRKFFNIDPKFMLGADLSNVNNDIDAGSGSIFISHGEFMIKGERASDWHSQVDWVSLFDFVEDYANWIMTKPDTLIPRFFTAFYDPEHQVYYFVMQNWIPSTWSPSVRVYDFKGSRIPVKRGDTNSRMVWVTDSSTDQQLSRQVLKDLNFLGQKVHVPRNVRAKLVEQLAADTAWLAEHNLMDYSLMLQVIHVGKSDAPSLENVCKPNLPLHTAISQQHHGFLVSVMPEDSTMYIYALGLIDILQPYSIFKAVGTAYDKVKFPQQTGELAMNNIPPKEYQRRFEGFFENMMVGDAEPLVCERTPGQKWYQSPVQFLDNLQAISNDTEEV